ncbi:Phospho-N-acetylmuramoyl-pentapeptide-transferase [Limimonas halophila]|uniref:Phospho-N-acetylmuramoyl-pentapeptide-transferase n=1 Tax=Limimonas halophila TaxID=1082479 RepID=A0A1G7U5J8_9PROT|nr:phospho-N-acetylmuramoyl-pentapeptide-transferase [Limimonas halophila]SDG42836.1 Phospho-N-acetylmuramoyl-pentapeptide-transferase [Limimonas halophila]
MLHNLLTPLSDELIVFNLFRYLTFRSGAATLTALAICFLLGGPLIRWLQSKQREGQPIREDGPETHLVGKKGTPTMGGMLILIALSVSTLLWADLTNGFVWAVLFLTLGFGAVGFADDFLKLTRRSHHGVPGKLRLGVEIAIALIAGLWVLYLTDPRLDTALALPFFKDLLLELGWAFPVLMVLVIVGASNAVNLTDGLDGLAIVPVMIVAACYALIAYLVGNSIFAGYLQIHHVPGTGELAVFCAALVGASLGFLWYNAPPAMVFMGDTGSLSCGAAVGGIAVITKHELVLVVIGGIFVLETVSVMAQVLSYKLLGRRIFRMAPLHHHFEKKGWQEETIVVRFWIIAAILALIGLSTLKLR